MGKGRNGLLTVFEIRNRCIRCIQNQSNPNTLLRLLIQTQETPLHDDRLLNSFTVTAVVASRCRRLSRCASCLTAHFLAPSAALFASATQAVSVAVSRLSHGLSEVCVIKMREIRRTSCLFSAHDLCYVLFGAREFGTGLLQPVVSQHSSRPLSPVSPGYTYSVLAFLFIKLARCFFERTTTGITVVRGARNGGQTYLSSLLLEVLLPSLVALVATRHFVVFVVGNRPKIVQGSLGAFLCRRAGFVVN